MKKIGRFSIALILFFHIGATSKEAAVELKKYAPISFQCDSSRDRTDLSLGKNGKYKIMAHVDIGSFESDKGTWKQQAEGIVELTSDVHFEPLVCDGIQVERGENFLAELAQVKEKISRYLKADAQQVFTKENIEAIDRIEASSKKVTKTLPRLVLVDETKSVKRAALANLVTCIDRFIERPIGSKRRLHLAKAQGNLFLFDLDWEGMNLQDALYEAQSVKKREGRYKNVYYAPIFTK